MSDELHLLGVFLDFENLALGFRDKDETFDIERVLARLVEKGNIVVKRAYADWRRFPRHAEALQEAAFEMYQIPIRGRSGKNSADMRLTVDAMDLCYSKQHIDTFVIVSGDSDFSPLVSKLKENGKTVIGLGMKDSTSDLLRDNCDEFIYYEDLEKETDQVSVELPPDLSPKERELFQLLLESCLALRRENREVLYASLIKETMKRKRPSFTESYYGYKSFSDVLRAAEEKGLVRLERDEARRALIVEAFGDELKEEASAKTAKKKRSRRRSARKAPA